ncbi:MAG: PASTA domain-containing protein [Bacteroidota bacterium]
MNDLKAFMASQYFGKLLLYGVGALVVFYGGIYLWLGIYTRHDDFIKVPDLTNKNLFDNKRLLENEGFKIEISDSSTYDASKRPGIVLDQDPSPGSLVKEGRTLYFTITRKNPPEVMLPDLIDNSLRQAESTLRSFGLLRGELIPRPDIAENAVLEMQVNGKKVEAGTKVDKGTVVDLVIGQGLEISRVLLPNLYGLTFQEALFVLQASGLKTGLTLFDASVVDSMNCKVYRQNPQFRLQESVLSGEAVDLFMTESEDVLNSNYINPNPDEEDI